MSTRSRIGIVKADGTVQSIYCHYEGYESHNGKILKESYTDTEKVEELLELGDISSLGDCPETCIAYHRDRNEDLEKPREDASLESFGRSDFEEYGYVFDGTKWVTFKAGY